MKLLSAIFFLLLINLTYSQDDSKHDPVFPESVFGEWYNSTGNGEYNGLLIHSGFIENGYRAYMYQETNKINDTTFSFSAKDAIGNLLNCELNILGKDSIQLKRGNSPFITYQKQELPANSTRITIAEIPEIIKQHWFTTDGKDAIEFEVSNNKFKFGNEDYLIEDIIHIEPSKSNQYRFIVKNDKEYWMFYFKNFSADFLQVGFNGEYGFLYKANKEYPDERIEDVSEYMASIVPKELRGNWLKTDGSNSWGYGFYYNYAVLNRVIWDYKSVEQKRKMFVITLENNGEEKIIYAKPNRDNTVRFGIDKNKILKYSLNLINNKDFKQPTDSPYKESDIFKMDSTTYAGIIKNYSKKSDQKTGMVYVNNIFTGNQESYLVKIKENGSFSIKFPLYYPQEIYVRLPNYHASAFVEPGKETWQLINSSKRDDVFFAGDCAQLNTDLNSLLFFTYDRSYYELQKNIKDIDLNDYKKSCFNIYKRQVKALDSVVTTRLLSNKAKQVMQLKLDYNLYENVLSYDMYNREKKKPKIDSTYMSFLTPEIYNNRLAVMAGGYSSFVNRLRFNNAIRKRISVSHPQIPEFAEILKDKGVVLTTEEQELINAHINFKKDNAEALKRQEDFYAQNKEVLKGYNEKFGKVYQQLSETDRKKLVTIDSIIVYAKRLNITFSDEEIAVNEKSTNLLTKEEQKKISAFYNEEQNKKNREFHNTYKAEKDEYIQKELRRKELENITQFFKGEGSWMQDLLIMQGVSGPISEQLSPLSNDDLELTLKDIKNPFVANYLKYENKKAIAKIEANKNNTGFVINETPKTEADKVFEAIITKYKGKVVFVDFWATWCGPCRSGMKKMKPLKEELKDKDIVFVYITNQTSPEKTWNNMIADIKGEHYRVSKDEWNYLGQKFNITGIPHYTLVNKEGKVVKEKIYFASSTDSFKQLFEEYLNKE